jgi:hypothetical protein
VRIPIREIVFVNEPTVYVGSPRAVFVMSLVLFFLLLMAIRVHPVLADTTTLPGIDASSQMEGAGTLLRFIDTAVFKWGSRLLAGLCVCGAGWSLKEGRYGPAVVSVISAFMIGTAPTWVKNIFAVGGSDSVFTSIELREETQIAAYFPTRINPKSEVENA